MCRSILIVLALLSSTSSRAATDEGSIRVRVNVDGVSLTITGEALGLPLYDSLLEAGEWYTIPRPSAEYRLVFSHPDYQAIDTLVQVNPDLATELKIFFANRDAIKQTVSSSDAIVAKPVVQVESDPLGLGITLDGDLSASATPAALELAPGSHDLTVFGEGWEPLSHTVGLDSLTSLRLLFVMREAPPAPPTPEIVGLAYDPEVTLRDEREANALQAKFSKAAETFLIFPLTQGIIMKLTLEEDGQSTADAFLISGAALSAGSYLLGRLFSSRKRKSIREYNERASISNRDTQLFNREVDRIVDSIHQAQLKDWEAENRDRGKVEESPR